MSENPSQSSLVSDVIYWFRQAQKRSSHFYFPAPLFNKTKAPTMVKCVVILMDFHSQFLRVRVEDWLLNSARGTVSRSC